MCNKALFYYSRKISKTYTFKNTLSQKSSKMRKYLWKSPFGYGQKESIFANLSLVYYDFLSNLHFILFRYYFHEFNWWKY